MAYLIATLPREIQLSIFCCSEDLDDALSLSQTCQNLRDVYATYQKVIERAIIISSHVYEYDFCLSHLLRLCEDLADVFRNSKSTSLTSEQRVSHEVLLAAVKTDWSKHPVTDDDIDAITLRWRQMGCLRGLYLDDLLSKEFELFRARFAAKLPKVIRNAIVDPGLIKSSTVSSRLKQSRQYSYDFKARFYKSLCLHSMAIATLQLAKVAPDSSGEPYQDHYEDFINITISLWAKHSVNLGGVKIFLDWDVKLDCLEVFDFLYMFLLRKLIPFERLDSWMNEDADVYPYVRDGLERDPGRIEEWYNFLENSRFVLKPHDIFDLIKHEVWRADSTLPWSKSTYMRARGMFDLTYDGDLDFYCWHTRVQMVQGLQDQYIRTTEDPCWWDHVRVICGSPFLPEATSKFQAETSKVQRAERAEKARIAQKMKALESAEIAEAAKKAKTEEIAESARN